MALRSGGRRPTSPTRSSHPVAASSSPAGARRSSARCPGPQGAPTVLLLHGWVATGGLNWFQAFDTLGDRFRVIAPDLRGHGQGIRSRRVFRLADCADDCAATLLELGTGPGDRRRLLDGRPGRAAAVAAPPRPRVGTGAVRDLGRLHAQPQRAPVVPVGDARARSTAARVATLTRARAVAPRLGSAAVAPARHGSPTRCAATTGARSSRPVTRSARTTPIAGSIRSTFRPRSCARHAITRCGPTYSSRSPTPSPAPPSTGSTTVTSRAPKPDFGRVLRDACTSVADRVARTARRRLSRSSPRTSAGGERCAQPGFTQPCTMPLSASGSRNAKRDVADDREQQADREPVVHEGRALAPGVGERRVPLHDRSAHQHHDASRRR